MRNSARYLLNQCMSVIMILVMIGVFLWFHTMIYLRIQDYLFSTRIFSLLHTYNGIIWDHKIRHNKHCWSWWKNSLGHGRYHGSPCWGTALNIDILSYYADVIMSAKAPQITSVSVVCPTVCSGADQIKHRSSASLAFVMWIHRWPMFRSPVQLTVRLQKD